MARLVLLLAHACGATLLGGFAGYFFLLAIDGIRASVGGAVVLPSDAFALCLAVVGVLSCLLFAGLQQLVRQAAPPAPPAERAAPAPPERDQKGL